MENTHALQMLQTLLHGLASLGEANPCDGQPLSPRVFYVCVINMPRVFAFRPSLQNQTLHPLK